jgi:steroid delta-isomerase-like uncharacterized protein
MQEFTPDALTAATIAVIQQFHEAFNLHDMEAVMAVVADDCVFENTSPPPDGERFEGREAVRGAWEQFFQSSAHAAFEIEDVVAHEDRAVVRWTYRWIDTTGKAGHVRGVDLMRVRDGKVTESLAYVKG